MQKFFILNANKCLLSDSINAKLFAILQRCDYDHFNQMNHNYDNTMKLECVSFNMQCDTVESEAEERKEFRKIATNKFQTRYRFA